MVVAKLMSGSDNNSFMHEVYPYMCELCNYPMKQVANPDFKIVKKNYDVSYTYDGYLIVSERFKLFCEAQEYLNIKFVSLPKSKDFYFAEIEESITLDYKKRNVQFIDHCPKCGNYAEVIGATPSYLNKDIVLDENSFYQSDFSFGSYERKSPLVIVSLKMEKEMKKQKFKSLYFKDVLLSEEE